MTIDEFEALVLAQRPAEEPWQPVTDYSDEARTIAEGQHPKLILETFRPEKIVDVGCGTKHLVESINAEVGWTMALGVDKSNDDADWPLDIAALSPPNIRADLVICREVLEHLTLMEIRRAVTNLCVLSTQFVYVTTRFSSEHDLLRVETSDDLDPTHITIPSKDLIRLLFVLEGFKRRVDLEERMDWKTLNRCLVYERAV